MSLSKNQLKLITSLQQKKYRLKHKLFVAEGTKVVNELLHSNFELSHLFCVDDLNYKNVENVQLISDLELRKISTLKSPNNVLALFVIPETEVIKTSGLIVGLDGVNDPGNLGTIIRLCDWFGVNQLVCSNDTVDRFNSKVVQASMGSLTRVSVVYTDLSKYVLHCNLPKYATLMDGDNVYKTNLPEDALLVMGNEANGISAPIIKALDRSLSIPRFGKEQLTESLNVATATAILLSEFKRGT